MDAHATHTHTHTQKYAYIVTQLYMLFIEMEHLTQQHWLLHIKVGLQNELQHSQKTIILFHIQTE